MSTGISDDTPYVSVNKKRTVKACDICRSRKLKCDGEKPCSRCKSTNTTCEYNYKEKRKKPTVKVTKATAINNLENRMSKLESLLTILVGKLDPETIRSKSSENDAKHNANDPAKDLSPMTQTETTSGSEIDSDDDHDSNDVSNSGGLIVENQTKNLESVDHKYFGSQSSLSALSARGIQWLAQQSGDPAMLPKFISIHRRFTLVLTQNVSKWTDTLDPSKLIPLPAKELTHSLIEAFFIDFGPHFIITKEEITELIENYYHNQDGSVPKKITYSEHLILNAVVSLGALLQIEQSDIPVSDGRLVVLRDIYEKYLDIAIYYYHRVSIICEDIKTIQGILLLVLHTDFSPPPQVNFMLITTAVRYAQELGLHRAETLFGLSEAEVDKRRRIWFHVYVADRDCCLRAGKPPLINDIDVTHVLPEDYYIITAERISPETKSLLSNPKFDLSDPDDRNKLRELSSHSNSTTYTVRILIVNYLSEYVKFTSESYFKLFSATSLIDKSPEEIMDIIENLNSKMEKITNRIPLCIRPGDNIEVDFMKFDEKHDVILIHLQYYLQTMLINRMAFRRAWINDDLSAVNSPSFISPKQKRLMDKCLQAARNSVKLFSKLQTVRPLFYYYTSFFFFSSFFTIFTCVIEDPKAKRAKSDLILLQDGLVLFLEKLTQYASRQKDNIIYNSASYFLKFFLKISISVYNIHHPNDKLDTTALDNEIKLHDKIMTFTSQGAKDIFPDGTVGYDPSSHKPFDSSHPDLGPNGHPQSTNDAGQQPLKFTFQHNASGQPMEPMPSYNSNLNSEENFNNSTPHQQQQQQHQQQQQFNSNPQNASLGGPVGQNVDPANQFGISDFEFEKNSTMFQQMFAFPNFYLTNADVPPLDNSAFNDHTNFEF